MKKQNNKELVLDQTNDKYITLYPSSWLYNASAIGFLRSLETVENIDVQTFLKDDGTVVFHRELFAKLDINKRYFKDGKISAIAGNTNLYRNYINPSRAEDKKHFGSYVKQLQKVTNNEKIACGVCQNHFALSKQSIDELNSIWKKENEEDDGENFIKFFNGINRFGIAFSNSIATSQEFPNGAWNCEDTFRVCPICSFLLIHHHLSFIKIRIKGADKNAKHKELFINAPSFKQMWILNKYANEIINKHEFINNSQILGLSFMQMAQKISYTLGAWSTMNIEMIVQSKDEIKNFSIPHNISKVLLNKEIASLIHQCGYFYIFDLILNGKFDTLLKLNNEILKKMLGGNSESPLLKSLFESGGSPLETLAKLLPELYIKIAKTQQGGNK